MGIYFLISEPSIFLSLSQFSKPLQRDAHQSDLNLLVVVGAHGVRPTSQSLPWFA